MRIIIANKYYFKTGGPEHYLFSLAEMLEKQGHEVIPFSIAATKNQSSPYEKYFVSSPIGPDKYDANLTEQKIGLSDKVKMARRAFYSGEARTKLRQLIRDTHPDIVYVLNFTSYLSPSIIDGAHDEHIPIVIQLPSFDLMCAANVFLRDGQVCTECLHGKFHAIQHRCVGHSLTASIAKVSAMNYHDAIGIYKKVDAFVAPSKFMKGKMTEAGFPADRIHHIPLFVDVSRFGPRPANEPSGDYILYFGRIAPEKGVGILVEAYALMGPSAPPLVLMGWTEPEEEKKLRARIAELNLQNVHFIGPKHGDEMVKILQYARLITVPSIWFENTPHTTYEAFGAGRPVVATNLGSLPEQVTHEVNGLLFEHQNPQDFARQMQRLIDNPEYGDSLGNNGLQLVHKEFSGQRHIERTLGLFNSLLGRSSVDDQTMKRSALPHH